MIDLALLTPYVAVAILLALYFDYYNGVNDAANSIATVVATRALKPPVAVLMAAFFNFVGAFASTKVAETVGKGIIDPGIITTTIVVAAVTGGLVWTAFASHFGVPISVSHSLIGGLVGAAAAAAGLAGLQLPTRDQVLPVLEVLVIGGLAGAFVMMVLALLRRARRPAKALLGGFALGSTFWLMASIMFAGLKIQKLVATVLFIVYSPLIGFLLAFAFTLAIASFARRAAPARLNRIFRWLQLGSSSFYSFGHGTNDAQKTMGVITALLVANGVLTDFAVPIEVIIAAGLAIALGTFIGGYKVVRTMGHKLTALQPYQGFSAETSSALGLSFLANQGVPVSTTHSIGGAIMGVGATRRLSAVSWSVARTMFLAWVITIPASATAAAVVYAVLSRVIT